MGEHAFPGSSPREKLWCLIAEAGLENQCDDLFSKLALTFVSAFAMCDKRFLLLQQREPFKKRWFALDPLERRLLYYKNPLVRAIPDPLLACSQSGGLIQKDHLLDSQDRGTSDRKACTLASHLCLCFSLSSIQDAQS